MAVHGRSVRLTDDHDMCVLCNLTASRTCG